MHWRDILDERTGTVRPWLGLRVEVTEAHLPRPPLQVQAGLSRCMRIELLGEPLLWARVDRDYDGYTYLRAARAEPLAIVPPISFSQAREFEPASPTWNRDWACYFASALLESPRSPLYRGLFSMMFCEASLGKVLRKVWERRPLAPPATHLSLVPTFADHDLSSWEMEKLAALPLRTLSDPESSRVKAFRKLARDGTLPPVLLWWIGGLDRYVILDGHDRLVAALLENKAPPCLSLLPLRELPRHVDPGVVEGVTTQLEEHAARGELGPEPRREDGRIRGISVDRANRLLIDTFDDRPYARIMTRAWPLRGGVAAWRSEVLAAIAAQRTHPLQRELLEEDPR